MSQNVPYELIWLILERIYFPSTRCHPSVRDWTPDRLTLENCSLVCKSWRDLSQRFLFHEVQRLKPSFLKAIRLGDHRAQVIGSYIRRLEVGINGRGTFGLSAGFFNPRDFIAVLLACGNLYELTLRIDAMHAFDDDVMQDLRYLSAHAPLSTISALNLMSFGIQSPIPYQLLSVMSGVRHLRLGTELAAPRPSEPCTARLYELALLRTPLNVNNVSWLLSNSEGHLRVLEFRDTPERSYDPLLAVHGPHIQSFRVLRQELRSSTIFKFCVNLKELIIYQFSDFIPIQNIPPSVEHLSFRYSAWAENSTLKPIIQTIEHLPNLRIVSCNKDTEKHAHFKFLRNMCKRKKVRLCIDAPPIFILDDPVDLRGMPRWKSITNIPLMNEEPWHQKL